LYTCCIHGWIEDLLSQVVRIAGAAIGLTKDEIIRAGEYGNLQMGKKNVQECVWDVKNSVAGLCFRSD